MDEERTLRVVKKIQMEGTWRAICSFNPESFPEQSPEKDLVVYNVVSGNWLF